MESRSFTPTPEMLLEHASWASALARRLVGESAAEDLVQETWLAALQSPPATDRGLRPWLGTVLGNFARQRSRGRGRRREREERGARAEALPSAAELTEKAESQKLLMEALLELDEGLREVLLLRFFEELSAAEIARRQGIPASTVKSRLERGLDALRVRLDDSVDGGRRAWNLALLPLLRPSGGGVESAVGLSASSVAGVLWMKTIGKLAFWSLVVLLGALGLTGVGYLVLLGTDESVPRDEVVFAPLVSVAEEVASDPTPEADGPSREVVPPSTPATTPTSEAETARIELRFVDRFHRPVEGVEVSRYSRSGAEAGRSGRDGRVAIQRQGDRKYRPVHLYYHHQRYAGDTVELELPPGRGIDLGDVVLRDGGALSGRVVDGGGNPLVGADVDVRGEMVARPSAGGMTSHSSTNLGAARDVTDEQGRFRLEGLLAGDVRVEVEAENGLYQGESGWVEIRPGQESSGLVIVVPITPEEERIEGIVLDPDGEPVPHCSVRAAYRTFFRSGSAGESTDDSGRFRILTRVDTDHELVARKDGWEPVILAGVRPGALDVVLRFRSSHTFQLAVVDERGRPVEAFACGVADESGEHSLQWSPAADRPGGLATLRVPSTSFTIEVLATGFARTVSGPHHPADHDADGGVISVTLHPIAGVTGRVVSSEGPVSGAALNLQRVAWERTYYNGFPVRIASRSTERTVSDERGEFRLDVREAGEYVIRAEAEGFAATELGPFTLDPERGLEHLEGRLTPGGSIHGRVVREPGRSSAGAIVAISRGDCWARTQRVGADGTFRFEHLIPGPWLVQRVDEEIGDDHSSSGDGFRSPFEEVPSSCVVEEGRVTLFDLVEVSGPICFLEGRFELGGRDLSGWRASLLATELPSGPVDESPAEVRLDPDGSFRFTVAGEGRRRLNLSGPKGESTVLFAVFLELVEGTNRWSATVEGAALTVVNPPRTPAALYWSGADGLLAYAPVFSETGESLTLDPVPAGAARIVAPDPNRPSVDPAEWPTLVELELPAGEETVVEL